MRIFLAVVDGGNLGVAAERLGLSQPTVGRRLSALEERFGTSLFARAGRKMIPTDAGNAILESARVMQREMDSIQRTIAGASRGLAGEVTISATEGTGSEWLIPVLEPLRSSYPDITIRLQIDIRAVDLVAREADIALRLGEPTQLELISRKLATIGFGLYAARSYCERAGRPEKLPDLANHDWVRGKFTARAGNNDRLSVFLADEGLPHRIAVTTNSPSAQIAAVDRGLGIGILSHRWAASFPNLVPLIPEFDAMTIDLWLVTHEDLRHSARIRAVADHIVAAAEADRELFALGRAAGVRDDAVVLRHPF
ncbi:MAG: LysR family transcriptional regulator [Pseudomonadota bacterium]